MIKFIEIDSIEYINDLQYVNDLSVENNHNYIANDYIVHNCITASCSGTYYPIATLIDECYQIKKNFADELAPKIIADGGIKDYRDINKALALGADYVMIGSLLSQCIESAGEKFNSNNKRFYIENYQDISLYTDLKENVCFQAYYTNEYINDYMEHINDCDYDYVLKQLHTKNDLGPLKVKFFGMASKDGQISMYGKKIKTAEGKTKILPVKYTLSGWVENVIHFMKTAMSYNDCKDIKDFIGETELIVNSISAINSVNK